MAKTCAGVDTNILECGGGGDAGVWAIIAGAINILSILVGIAGVIGIAIFGIQVLTAKGDSSKIQKSKQRLFQIVLGLSAYILLWAGSQWLLPGGLFHIPNDIKSISIEFWSGTIYVGDPVAPRIKFDPESPLDPSYTITSHDERVLVVNDNTIRCLKAGEAKITVKSVNNKESTATVHCINKPKPVRNEDEDDDDGDTSDGTYYEPTPEQINAFNKEWDSLEDVTYEEIKKLAQEKGISERNFIGLVAWAHFESYEIDPQYGPYFAYLCNSVAVNSSLSFQQNGKTGGWTDLMLEWGKRGGPYWNTEFVGTTANPGYNYNEGYFQSNLNSVYMALKNTYPNIYGCSGHTSQGGGFDSGVNKAIYDPVGCASRNDDCGLIFDGVPPM